jgi:crotonobetainyl-CoA hydratase
MLATEALRWGLVNKVVPHDLLIPTSIEMAVKICEASSIAIRASKDVIYRGLDQSLDFPGDAWALNERYIDIVYADENAQEGLRAFQEKRKPVWKE